MPRQDKYHREILVCVLGLTPQVLTETLYCLMVRRNPIQINEIYAITTLKGYEAAVRSLLDPEKGMFYRFCDEYRISPGRIRFTDDQIYVISDRSGRKLADIRTHHENEIAQQFIFDFIRDLTEDPNSRLHCSVAGGRKTLSVILAFALQLLGRKQDRLYHVLTKEDIEGHPEFFYKPRKRKILLTQSGKVIDASRVHIDLAEIPFVSLRDLTQAAPKSALTDFRKAIGEIQKAMSLSIKAREITIVRRPFDIAINNRSIGLAKSQARIYAYFLLQKLKCRRKRSCQDCSQCYPLISKANIDDFWQKLITDTSRICQCSGEPSLKTSIEQFRSQISKINSAIDRHLANDPFCASYRISSVGRRSEKSYGIPIDRNLIRIV